MNYHLPVSHTKLEIFAHRTDFLPINIPDPSILKANMSEEIHKVMLIDTQWHPPLISYISRSCHKVIFEPIKKKESAMVFHSPLVTKILTEQ